MPALGTVLRVAAASTLLAVALAVYTPRVVEERTREAIVNARLEPVQAPVGGTLVRALGDPGRAVAAGAVVAEIEDPRVSRAALSRFEAELAAARASLAEAENTLRRLGELRRGLEARAERFARAALASRVLDRRALEERLVAARAAVAERRSHLARVRRLRRSRAVPEEEVQKAERDVIEAEARLRALRWQLERMRGEVRELARGVFLGQGGADVPYSRQRMDELLATEANWRTRRADLAARVTTLERAVARERRRLAARARVAVRAPMDAVVWRRDVSAGAEVTRGQRLGALLDCRRLYVTAIVHQRGFPDIRRGLPARVRPFGETRWFSGRVIGVRAAPLVPEDGFAVLLRPLEEDEAVVLVELADSDLQDDAARFCHVGRSVELALERDWTLVRLWRRLWPGGDEGAATAQGQETGWGQTTAESAPAAPPATAGEAARGTVGAPVAGGEPAPRLRRLSAADGAPPIGADARRHEAVREVVPAMRRVPKAVRGGILSTVTGDLGSSSPPGDEPTPAEVPAAEPTYGPAASGPRTTVRATRHEAQPLGGTRVSVAPVIGISGIAFPTARGMGVRRTVADGERFDVDAGGTAEVRNPAAPGGDADLEGRREETWRMPRVADGVSPATGEGVPSATEEGARHAPATGDAG